MSCVFRVCVDAGVFLCVCAFVRTFVRSCVCVRVIHSFVLYERIV